MNGKGGRTGDPMIGIKGYKTRFNSETGRKASVKGIQKQQEMRAERRTMRAILDELLSRPDLATNSSCKEAMMLKAVLQAIDGDPRAREFIRDTIGEKPITVEAELPTVKTVFVSAEDTESVLKHIKSVINDK